MGRRRLTVGAIAAAITVLLVSAAWATVPRLFGTPHRQTIVRQAQTEAAPAWSTVWSTSVATIGPTSRKPGVTYREIVHLTAGGSSLRLRLTNRFGWVPVSFGHITLGYAVSAARAAQGATPGSGATEAAGTPPQGTSMGGAGAGDGVLGSGQGGDAGAGGVASGVRETAGADRESLRTVTFGGSETLRLGPGGEAVSDAIPLSALGGTTLVISLWVPAGGEPSYHANARQISYVATGTADHAGDTDAKAFTRTTLSWFYLEAVEASGAPGTIVALGDSITDGALSSPSLDHRWTDYLAARLAAAGKPEYGIANSGISGNRVRLDAPDHAGTDGPSALARLRPDVLDRSGARTVIVLEGINDLLLSPQATDPEEVIVALAQIALECHAAGLRVIGGTLMPAQGWHAWDPAVELVRQQVNAWIRSGGDGSFDAVADFDAAVRDPKNPQQLYPLFDSGDHLHPDDAGDAAMAGAVPLNAL